MKSEEHNIQTACVTWFRYQYPEYLIFAVPNGGKRDKRTIYRRGVPITYSPTAAKLKEEGALAGVADLIIVAHNKTVFVEMKTAKGKQEVSQKVFERNVQRLGHPYLLCHSFDEFQDKVKRELNFTK